MQARLRVGCRRGRPRCPWPWNCRAAHDVHRPVTTISDTIEIGARLTRKALNERPVAPAIMMLGGSPTSVAVPPMLDAMICMISSGTGGMPNFDATMIVIGAISRIDVRLSRNADSTAVIVTISITTASGRPSETRIATIASCSKMPVRSVIVTMIIIPTSSPSVSRSIASNASCWSSTPASTNSGRAGEHDHGAMQPFGGDQQQREDERYGCENFKQGQALSPAPRATRIRVARPCADSPGSRPCTCQSMR